MNIIFHGFEELFEEPQTSFFYPQKATNEHNVSLWRQYAKGNMAH